MALIDLTGKRFGRTTVVAFERFDLSKSIPAGRTKRKPIAVWRCLCDCGAEHLARGGNLKSGNTASCGCLHIGGRPAERHGHYNSGSYSSWDHMNQRCRNPKNKKYPLYGGRGITVCDRWSTFSAFLEDMGERPDGKTLDRIDPERGYSPDNCRWATVVEQNRNLRTATRTVFEGREVPLTELAERFGIHIKTLKGRLGWGWSLDRALTEPLHETAPSFGRRKAA